MISIVKFPVLYHAQQLTETEIERILSQYLPDISSVLSVTTVKMLSANVRYASLDVVMP